MADELLWKNPAPHAAPHSTPSKCTTVIVTNGSRAMADEVMTLEQLCADLRAWIADRTHKTSISPEQALAGMEVAAGQLEALRAELAGTKERIAGAPVAEVRCRNAEWIIYPKSPGMDAVIGQRVSLLLCSATREAAE